ncbi:hypothetical protein [Vulgatibacter sp.]|uniref:hypothetical protein n=1 Tax=Vulgatibacter sp. TaxID=1971226 RepID=UPI003564F745
MLSIGPEGDDDPLVLDTSPIDIRLTPDGAALEGRFSGLVIEHYLNGSLAAQLREGHFRIPYPVFTY